MSILSNYFRSNITVSVIAIVVLGAIFAIYKSYADTDALIETLATKGYTQEQINAILNPMEGEARIVSQMIEQKYPVSEINEYLHPSDKDNAIIVLLAKQGYSPGELSCFSDPVNNSDPGDRIRFCTMVREKVAKDQIDYDQIVKK